MNSKNTIEDVTSFLLYQRRRAGRNDDDDDDSLVESSRQQHHDHQQQRRLKHHDSSSSSSSHKRKDDGENDDDSNHKNSVHDYKYEDPRIKKMIKKKPPKATGSTSHGLMIDAGSQGTRLHVYEFEARKLHNEDEVHQAITGMKLTFPTTDSRWTNRLTPGLDAFAFVDDDDKMINEVKNYLDPVLNFSKTVLKDKSNDWYKYPIYIKATGGLRSLPRPYRIRLIDAVRQIFHDKSFNPFLFQDEHARVISGEEEAIYGWTAVNFVKGALIEASKGVGSVSKSAYKTYGVLEMGGASAQIGFFEPNGDTMANLFKLQIGAAKHWNVYVHSFLYFGVNLAYDVLNAGLYTQAMQELNSSSAKSLWGADMGIYNPCLPGGSHYLFSSRVHAFPNGTLLPMSSQVDPSVIEADIYSAIMKNDKGTGDYDACTAIVHKLLRKDSNGWCNFAHDRDCSFAGIYQPPIPVGEKYFGEFIATSNFFDVFDFLGLSYEKVTMQQLLDKSKMICTMSEGEMIAYNNHQPRPTSSMDDVNAMCFRSVFVSAFLIGGVGFLPTDSITAVDVIDGQKLGWALGSMLYEINTLPWDIKLSRGLFKTHHLFDQIALPGNITAADFDVRGVLGLLALLAVFSTAKVLFSRKRSHRKHNGTLRANARSGELSALIHLSSPIHSYCSEERTSL